MNVEGDFWLPSIPIREVLGFATHTLNPLVPDTPDGRELAHMVAAAAEAELELGDVPDILQEQIKRSINNIYASSPERLA